MAGRRTGSPGYDNASHSQIGPVVAEKGTGAPGHDCNYGRNVARWAGSVARINVPFDNMGSTNGNPGDPTTRRTLSPVLCSSEGKGGCCRNRYGRVPRTHVSLGLVLLWGAGLDGARECEGVDSCGPGSMTLDWLVFKTLGSSEGWPADASQGYAGPDGRSGPGFLLRWRVCPLIWPPHQDEGDALARFSKPAVSTIAAAHPKSNCSEERPGKKERERAWESCDAAMQQPGSVSLFGLPKKFPSVPVDAAAFIGRVWLTTGV
ncbi:hypothetical protein JX266_002813 [Neoarthrinium moseri]|nr:hypothetical protein JX266_002813 [Neoarthrinium moseri]